MNTPNALSLLRILLIPLFVYFASQRSFEAALAVFAAAAVTDALDGFIARFFHLQTALGAYLDPIADKLLLVSAFVTCACMGIIPWWLAALVVLRDAVIAAGILLLHLRSVLRMIRPTVISKCNTFFQIASVVICLALLVAQERMVWAALPDGALLARSGIWAVTGVLTAVSGAHYVWREIVFMKQRKNGVT